MLDNISLDQLAAMQRGFENTTTKADLRLVADQLELVGADVRDIKVGFAGLARLVTDLEGTVKRLEQRVTRLEEKTGRPRSIRIPLPPQSTRRPFGVPGFVIRRAQSGPASRTERSGERGAFPSQASQRGARSVARIAFVVPSKPLCKC